MHVDNAHPDFIKPGILDKKRIGYSLTAGAILAGGKSFATVQYSGPQNLYVYAGPGPSVPVAFPG